MPSPAPDLVTSAPSHGRGDRQGSPERAAVEDMLRRYAETAGVSLRPASVTLPSGARVLVDGATDDGSLYVEAHGATSPLRHLDLVLIAQDVFKMSLLRSSHPGARTVVLVTDTDVREAVLASVERTPAAGIVEITVCP